MATVDKEQLRITALAETQYLNNKQGFGFFSIPVSTAIGDDGPYRTRLHPRNEMGKPQTSPRNFQTSPTKTGQSPKSFFGPLNSLADGTKKDQYIQIPKRLMYEQNAQRSKCRKQRQFYPASCDKLVIKSSYEYKQEMNPQKDPKRNKDPETGRVKSKARNLQTNMQSTVISNYFKPITNISDPFERAHDIQWERQKNQKAKEGEIPFSPNKFRSDSFNPDSSIYEDFQFKKISNPFKQTQFNIRKHERRWRDTNPNRRGLYGFLQPFPRYMEDPPIQKMRKDTSSQKQIFKGMVATTLATPSQSITSHPSNLRKLLSNSFSHRY